MVADSCPECNAGDVDSNLLVWDSVTGNESPSRFDASWEFVECPPAFRPNSKTQLRWKEGSSQWWLGLQPTNMRHGITSITATRSDGTDFSLPVGGNAVGFSFWLVEKFKRCLRTLSISTNDVRLNRVCLAYSNEDRHTRTGHKPQDRA